MYSRKDVSLWRTRKRFLDAMESDIMNADIPEAEKSRLIEKFFAFKRAKD